MVHLFSSPRLNSCSPFQSMRAISMRGITMRGILLFAFLLLAAACSQVKDTTEIKLAHGLDISHPVHKAMEFMAERVKEKSGGKLTVDIFPSGQLGSERESLELLQIGSLGITRILFRLPAALCQLPLPAHGSNVLYL